MHDYENAGVDGYWVYPDEFVDILEIMRQKDMTSIDLIDNEQLAPIAGTIIDLLYHLDFDRAYLISSESKEVIGSVIHLARERAIIRSESEAALDV